MPHVMTIEGLTSDQLASLGAEPTVAFPPAGSPLAPHAAIVGPTRVATPVYGPGGTPVMYRRRYPARGPVCDYSESKQDFVVVDGGQHVIPPRQQLGDVTDWLRQRHPLVAGALILGGSLLTGAAVSGLAIWLYYKAGGRPKKPAWEEW